MFNTWQTSMAQPIQDTFLTWLSYLPNFLYALIIFGFGWLLARGFRRICLRLGQKLLQQGEQPVFSNFSFQSLQAFPALIGSIGFAFVLIFFLGAALQALGLNVLPMLATQLGALLPQIFIALVVFTITYILSKIIKEVIASSQITANLANQNGAILFLQILVWSIGVLIIVEQLGMRSQALLILFSIMAGALFFSFGLAFGLGAKELAANILSMRYAEKQFHLGDTVRLPAIYLADHNGDDQHGIIGKITPTSVIVYTEKGQIHIPGKDFTNHAIMIITQHENQTT